MRDSGTTRGLSRRTYGVMPRAASSTYTSGDSASMDGAAAFQTSRTRAPGPPLGYWPGVSCPGCGPSHAFTIHREVLLGFAAARELFDVAAERPRHEGLLGSRVVAEHLGPGTRLPAEPIDQRIRHGARPCGVRERAPVSGVAEQADLVLHLDQDDRVVGVVFGEVTHQRGEGGSVGLDQFAGEDGEDRFRHRSGVRERLVAASTDDGTRESCDVSAHPARRVRGRRVLERTEPDEHEPQTGCSCRLQQAIDGLEVEQALLRLDELPARGTDHRRRAECRHAVEGLPAARPRSRWSCAAGRRAGSWAPHRS